MNEVAQAKPQLLGMSVRDLVRLANELGEPGYRAEQVLRWTFARHVLSFDAMTNLPKRFRTALGERVDLGLPRIAAVQTGSDGTRKYLFAGTDGAAFESVYIPDVAEGRTTNTLCVSSQSGCSLGCAFCFTASLRHYRDLTASEIVGQVLAVQNDVAPLGQAARVTNVVYMGMGEPLLNYGEVVRSASLLIDPQAGGFSNRRVTISTAGIVPRIADLGRTLMVQLAISLNATTDEVRSRIMPINKKYPLAELMAALRAYPLPPRRRFTIEYVLLAGVNDSIEDAERLPRLLSGIPCKVNLLPLNPHERTPFLPPTREHVERFQTILVNAGLNTIIRTARGQDIAAACGQLGGQASTPIPACEATGSGP